MNQLDSESILISENDSIISDHTISIDGSGGGGGRKIIEKKQAKIQKNSLQISQNIMNVDIHSNFDPSIKLFSNSIHIKDTPHQVQNMSKNMKKLEICLENTQTIPPCKFEGLLNTPTERIL